MHKKLFAVLLVVSLPLIASAAYNDVSLTTDAVIRLGTSNLTVSGSTASVESVVVNASNFNVTLPNGSSITVTSADRHDFTTSANGVYYTVTETCGGSSSTVALSNSNAGSVTVTVTAEGTCDSSSSSSLPGQGGIIGGGGGGGGGGAAPTPVTQTPIPPAPKPPAPPVPVPTVSSVFIRTLVAGSKGEDVSRLQQILASDPAIYPEGTVSGFFGALTRAAVGRFQEKYGLAKRGDSGYGVVGPKTRAKLAELGGGTGAPPKPPEPGATPQIGTPSGGGSITKSLRRGARDGEVALVQKILNRDPETRIAASGDGSPGNETDFFGRLTEEAVKRFQVKHGIAGPGVTGYGLVGPKTRAKLNEVGSQ